MRKYGFLVAFILLALVVAGCATGTPVAPAATPVPAPPTEEVAAPPIEEVTAPAVATDYVGTFTVSLPAADSPGRIVTAVLAEDGVIQVTSDYQNGQPPIVETGTWQSNADGGITVTLTEQDGQAYFEPQVVPVMLDAATGELVVTGADGVVVRMAPGSIEMPTPVATTVTALVDPTDYFGTYTLSSPDGGLLTFTVEEDGAIQATITYQEGVPSSAVTRVISGTWQPNASGGLIATLTAQDGQAVEPVDLQLTLDAATDELVVGDASGDVIRLARTTGEAVVMPDATTGMTPTVEMTATEAMTLTAPLTDTKAMTVTAPMTATETITATAPVTTTDAVTASADAMVAETLENTYIASLPAASGGGDRLIALHLHDNGTVRMATDYQTDQPNIVEFGTWQDNGDGTVTVTLTGQEDEPYDEPEVITFKQDGDLLEAVDYDTSLWGSEGLTLRRASDVAKALNTSLISIDLQAGFPLDPTFVSVNAGGQVDASLLNDECSGFINTQPVVTVHWAGNAPFVKAFFVSDDDPTMVVGTPDGQMLCNDDATDQLLDPRIRIDDPITGTYKIWLGGYSRNQLIPGVLVLTTKEDVTLGTFDLGSFIRRPALPEDLAEPTPVASPLVTGTATLKMAAIPELTADTPITMSVVASGTIPLFQMNLDDPTCNGLVSGVPDYVFRWSGDAEQLRIFFEGDADSTLLVVESAQRTVACADDVETGNGNPLVTIDNPAEGLYGVWIGRLDPAKPVNGILTVTTAADATPAVLEPATAPTGGGGSPNPAQ